MGDLIRCANCNHIKSMHCKMRLPGESTGCVREECPCLRWQEPKLGAILADLVRDTMRATKVTKCYLAGPMSGYPEYNYPAFAAAADALRANGWVVFNPAENEADESEKQGGTAAEYRKYLAIDLPAVLESERVFVLPGWEKSRGARMEVSLALLAGIEVWPYDDEALYSLDQITEVPLFAGWSGHQTYYRLLEDAARIHAKKNKDYGGQRGDPLSNFKDAVKLGVTPFDGCLVRMSDKFARICNLNRKEKEGEGASVSDESIEDTLVDLANYALLAICLRRDATNA